MQIKEIPNTKLLVSLHHSDESANLGIFDVSRKQVRKIYAFEEVVGCKSNLIAIIANLSPTKINFSCVPLTSCCSSKSE